ncbi:hypothetical protein TrVE_jg9809 [Triparma verrucosa]|uniref:tRNA pseudouridine synthase n=1 Tax=Triparma verrucosa TaxID=1606542 RepID=A0A9W7CBD9_9STRA|nr:hypothetical protein TrVE_jg9809 [Triparma verrucosa]
MQLKFIIVALLLPFFTVCSSLRLLALVRYNGSAFRGVQRNFAADGSELRTIIGTFAESVSAEVEAAKNFRAASRTDAGVSAIGQAITFDIPEGTNRLTSSEAVNALLPSDLQVTSLEVVAEDFNVVKCRWKRYRYLLREEAQEKGAAEVEGEDASMMRKCISHALRGKRKEEEATDDGKRSRRKRVKSFPGLDLEAMRISASLVEGKHDFARFQAKGGDQKGSVRTIYRCEIEETGGGGVLLLIEGDGFLYKMVRILAGSILSVGMGLREAVDIKRALDDDIDGEGGTVAVGPTLPPERLVLEHIEY